jgi:hypothetical protein
VADHFGELVGFLPSRRERTNASTAGTADRPTCRILGDFVFGFDLWQNFLKQKFFKSNLKSAFTAIKESTYDEEEETKSVMEKEPDSNLICFKLGLASLIISMKSM